MGNILIKTLAQKILYSKYDTTDGFCVMTFICQLMTCTILFSIFVFLSLVWYKGPNHRCISTFDVLGYKNVLCFSFT